MDDKNMDRLVGAKVRDLRRASGITQEQFADSTGIHRSFMGEIERGDAHIQISTLVKIARGLKMPPSELLLGLGDPIAPDKPTRAPGADRADGPRKPAANAKRQVAAKAKAKTKKKKTLPKKASFVVFEV